jgi:riboflavin biosynthesis pyrimidine reductase
LHVIKIQDAAPKSSTDFFVLSFWRAHCDAIVTTGQILRAEPTLSYALHEDAAHSREPLALGLTLYRRDVLQKSRPTRCAILTRGSQLPWDHPVLRGEPGIEVVVLTQPQRVSELRTLLADRAEVVGLDALDARAALDYLRSTGAQTIGVEAGPSVAGTLYSSPAAVEHLMLSICEAPIEAQCVGGALPADAELFAGFALISDVVRAEERGPWRFQHWRRVRS